MGRAVGVIVMVLGLAFLFYHFIYKGTEQAAQYSGAAVKAPERANELRLKQNLRLIRAAVQQFLATKQRFPESLDELAEKSFIDHIPEEPFGGSFVYDPDTGKVKSSTHPKL